MRTACACASLARSGEVPSHDRRPGPYMEPESFMRGRVAIGGQMRRNREEWVWITLMIVAVAVMIGLTVWDWTGR